MKMKLVALVVMCAFVLGWKDRRYVSCHLKSFTFDKN
jgi:hypothetical protein